MLKTNKKLPTLRDVKIKTGVVKRTGQELVMYEKESLKQKERIEKLIQSSADSHDISKQNEVLDETTQMLPDCKSRLLKAKAELAAMIELLKDQESTEEIAAAIAIIASTEPLVA